MEDIHARLELWPDIYTGGWESPEGHWRDRSDVYAILSLLVVHSPDRRQIRLGHDARCANLRVTWFWMGEPQAFTQIMEAAKPLGGNLVLSFEKCAAIEPRRNYTHQELERIPRDEEYTISMPETKFLELREEYAKFLQGKKS